MGNIISIFGLLTGLFGMLGIAFYKAPSLVNADPLDFKKGVLKKEVKRFLHNVLEKIRSFSPYAFLHKALSKIKVLNLKIEKIIDYWLKKIRQKKEE